ncbi:MAG: RidA family protein [Planctomycetales bacterium]|nr:RidA family protein [Planctomycetales bacterium]
MSSQFGPQGLACAFKGSFPLPVITSVFVVLLVGGNLAGVEPGLSRIGARPEAGRSDAVVVSNAALAHTAQLLPGAAVASSAGEHCKAALQRLGALLQQEQAQTGDVVRLNVYLRHSQDRAAVDRVLADWSAGNPPAVSYVATPLPGGALVALDAVFISRASPRSTQLPIRRGGTTPGRADVCVGPPGDWTFVSGQAAAGDLRTATRDTLAGLLKTIDGIGMSREHVVAIKCFLQPMKDHESVNDEIARAFAPALAPPVSHVEWIAGSRPIEIELVAWAPSGETSLHAKQPRIEFHTPAWLKPSPVFSRVATIRGNQLIYLSSLHADKPGDGAEQARSLFSQLQSVTAASGSSMQDLAKATYYVSSDAASRALNDLRPSQYHPERPPAASKAMVSDVGAVDRHLVLDMIAAPANQPR